MMHLRFLMVVGVGCVAPAASAIAQRVTGVVQETQTGRPLAGSVVLLVDSGGRALARTITDTAGRYGLPWPAAGAGVRVVRMGFQPANERRLSGAPRDTSIDIAMNRLPAMLTAVRVTSTAVCSDTPDRHGALALWDQARAGLLATLVAREAAPARLTRLTFERRLDRDSRRVTQIVARTATGAGNRPFRAARSGDELVRLGYAESQGREATFFAPDADVLLEESFASAHCFSVQRGDGPRTGLIGLAFEPRARRGRETFVDVRGVLWLNPDGPTLNDLEFRFTGLHPVAMRSGAGGALRFQTMSSGVAFVSEWTMLLPALLPGPGPRSPPSLSALGETGGIVLDAAWPDGTNWHTSIARLKGRAIERGSGAPIAGAIVTLEGLNDTVTAAPDGSFTLPPLPAGLYAMHVTDTTLFNFLEPRAVVRDVRIGGEVTVVPLELLSSLAIASELCKGQRARAGTATLLGRVTDTDSAVAKDLVIESAWQADYAVGRDARDLTITEARQTTDLDSRGTFAVCGAALDRRVRLRLRMGNVPIADTVVTPSRTPFHTVHWALRPGVLAAARRGDASSLVGTIVDEAGGAPVAGAEVWLLLDDARVTTDSSGMFAMHGVSARRHFVQVRRLGYVMRRDTVTLFAGRQTERRFPLSSQAVMLDTVRTVAEGVRYLSPGLRGFEERRATGQGHFLAESELRQNDNRTLANVLRRIPGIIIQSGRTGDYVASTRGGGVKPGDTMPPQADPFDRMSPRGCWVAVYIDGVPIYLGPPQPAPDFARLPVQEFAAVEYYAGGATVPIQYNATKASDCGVMLLWTRER